MKILNLGCGSTRLPNSIGMDGVEISGFTDIIHDLNVIPYPFCDDEFDEVHCYHVLEHLDNPLKVMEEINRIMKSGGKLFLRVPHFSSCSAFTDITHRRPFSYFSFDIFLKNTYHNWYSKVFYKILYRRIKFFGLYKNEQPYIMIHPNQCNFLIRPLVLMLDYLINLSPIFFERIWCYWVGGACEINFIFEKE